MKTEESALRTIVEMPKWTRPMLRSHRIVLLGSCFAQYMGERFISEGMDVVCNPLGAAYNPESIAIQVQKALDCAKLTRRNDGTEDASPFDPLPTSIFQYDGKWRSWWANTLLSDTDKERFCETIHDTFLLLGNAILQADWLFLTLGTNVCYRLKQSGMTVTNCHKVPSREFEEVTLSLDACTDILCNMLKLLTEECPKLRIVFTVSPYRYRKYGFHGSQLAKATLLLAVDDICKRFPEKASYFPAYEIMLDELRDYSFYADDMIHPAPAAADYIWAKLKAGFSV